MKKLICMAVCVALCLGGGSIPVFGLTALTPKQQAVKDAGFHVTWIDAGPEYVSYDMGFSADAPSYIKGITKTGVEKYGYMTNDGEIFTGMVYDDAYFFFDGLSCVTQGDKMYYIDTKGNKVLDVSQYDEGGAFGNGYAAVIKNTADGELYGMIDLTGKEIIPLKYTGYPRVMDNGLIAVETEREIALFDASGKQLTDFLYSFCDSDGDLVHVAARGKWGALDINGEEVIPLMYDSYETFSEGLAFVKKGEKWGYIDKTGKEVIPFLYDNYVDSTFSEGLAAVKKDGKMGYIDHEGNTVIPFIYDLAEPFKDGVAMVKAQGAYCIIDKTGKTIIGPKEYQLWPAGNGLYYGRYIATDPMVYALLDKEGNRLTPFQYSHLYRWDGGFTLMSSQAPSSRDWLWGVVNQHGQVVVPMMFNWINHIEGGNFFVKIQDKTDSGDSVTHIGILRLPASAAEEKTGELRPITVYLDDRELYFDTEIPIENGHALVPMRKIFESFGATVEWDDKTKTVTAVKGTQTIKLTINAAEAMVNEKAVHLDASAVIYENRMLVPLRFISEALNAGVSWDQTHRRVYITSQP